MIDEKQLELYERLLKVTKESIGTGMLHTFNVYDLAKEYKNITAQTQEGETK